MKVNKDKSRSFLNKIVQPVKYKEDKESDIDNVLTNFLTQGSPKRVVVSVCS